MQDLAILLKPVSEIEIAELSELAKVIWQEHYPPIIGQTQVDYMLQHLYNYESLLNQLKIQKQQFYFISYDSVTIGFISVTHKHNQHWQINKFYILKKFSGNGIGSEVLHSIKNTTQAKKISLTVNRDNFKSINFYFKNGFRIESVEKFDIGNGFFMDDYVMIREEKI